MDHTKALNRILANACPMRIRPDGFYEYHIELCCHAFIVTAKHNGDLTYEIKEINEVTDAVSVPTCDTCGMREEDVRGWCGTCGSCSQHCEQYIDCPEEKRR